MERLVKGQVVVLPFPYTDLSNVKKRPALVVAKLEGGNVILVQITTNKRTDKDIIALTSKDFASGTLKHDSFIMPSLIFTIDSSRIEYVAGKLKQEKINIIQNKICEIFTR